MIKMLKTDFVQIKKFFASIISKAILGYLFVLFDFITQPLSGAQLKVITVVPSTKLAYNFLFNPHRRIRCPPLWQLKCHISRPAPAASFQNQNQINYTDTCDFGTPLKTKPLSTQLKLDKLQN